jgi:predicted metalloprotease with PDZ domain
MARRVPTVALAMCGVSTTFGTVSSAGGLTIHHVLRGGAAEKAGFATGDEWLAVQAAGGKATGPWRMQSLDDLMLYAGNAKKVLATISRDKLLLTLSLTLPKASQAVRLAGADVPTLNRWLDAPATP